MLYGAGTCTFAIFPVNTTSGPTGGPGAFAIVPNAEDCGWWVEAHSPDDDWILEDFSQGIGTGVATYRVAPSTEPNRPALSRWDRLLRSGRLSERSVPEVRS